MIEYSNGARLVEAISELPQFSDEDLRELFADFETTSGDDKKDSLNPWHNCAVAGIAVTVRCSY
jgi:hypothetical protein